MDVKQFEGSTPGPWAPDEEQYCQYVFGPDGEMICEMRGWGYLTGNRRNLSEEDALKIQSWNCRLVAAAPDLLKENQSLRSELQKLQQWKKEQMQVWGPVLDYMQKHPELSLGESISKRVLEFLKEREKQKELNAELVEVGSRLINPGILFSEDLFDVALEKFKSLIKKYKES